MKENLYLECYSGISGDMMVGSLIDLGADVDVLMDVLNSIDIEGFKVEVSRVSKSGLDACDFNVRLDEKYENNDCNMEFLYGEDFNLNKHHHNNHHHEHRRLNDVIEIINNIKASDKSKKIAKKIFEVLAKAEAKAHGKSIEDVHFHEVGAIDSIVDIISVAVCLDNLQINQVIVPILHEGTGFVRCQHGMIPIPVPAVSNIVLDNGLKLHITSTEGELVTPTGAAIVAAIKTSDKLPKEFSIKKVGIGAGKRNYDRPSILRAMLIESE